MRYAGTVTFIALVLALCATAMSCKEKELDTAAYVAPASGFGFDPGIPVFGTKADFEKQMMLSADKPDSEEYKASLLTLKRLAPNTRVVVRRLGTFSYKGYNPEYAEIEVAEGPELGKRFFVRSNGLQVGVPSVQASATPRTSVNVDQCRSACFTRKVRELEKAGKSPNTEPGGPGLVQAACQEECLAK